MTRYCIGCRHLEFIESDPGLMGSTWTGVYGDHDAALACKMDHWKHEFTSYSTIADFERAMKKAATCEDYEERVIP